MDPGLARRVATRFHGDFGKSGDSPPRRPFFPSGRVNPLAAHVDYHGGPVLPVAVDRGVCVAARARADRTVRCVSLDFEQRFEWKLDALPNAATMGWSVYPLAILATLERDGARLPGFDFVFGG